MSENDEKKASELKSSSEKVDKVPDNSNEVQKKELSVEEKLKDTEDKLLRSLAEIENQMISDFHQFNYFKYLVLTLFGKGFGDRIKKR